jgi:hypothetical protein
MLPKYHRQITQKALSAYFADQELREVISGNLWQDRPAGQFGHPEFHFDDCEFDRSYKYLDELRTRIELSMNSGNAMNNARSDFGKLTHALQDFYAHSNYVRLWGAKHGIHPQQWNGEIDCMDDEILHSKDLISGHFYSPWEMITFIPFIGRFVASLFPDDSHSYLNNDSPYKNLWFPLAFKCAVLRTQAEFSVLSSNLLQNNPENLYKFLGKSINPINGV